VNNSKKIRVHLSRVLLPFLTIWLCVLPAKSYAVVPLLAWGATAAVAAGDSAAAFAATATAIDIGTVAMQSLVGMSMAALILGNSVGDSVRIPTTAAAPIPAPTAPSTAPTPPAACLSNIPAVGGGSSGSASAPADIANGWLPYLKSVYGNGVVLVDAGTLLHGQCNSIYVPMVNAVFDNVWPDGSHHYLSQSFYPNGQTALATCPNGYTLTGGICTLNNARMAVSDKAVDYAVSNGAYAQQASDLDVVTNPLKGGTTSNGSYTLAGAGVGGQPKSVTVTPSAGGGSTVALSQQGSDASGNTMTTTTTIVVDPNARVASVAQTQKATALVVDPVTQMAVTQATGGADPISQSQPIVFPNDYARSGEAAQAAAGTNARIDATNTKLDSIHADLSTTTVLGDPLAPVAGDMPGWGNTFTNLLSWNLPAHASACPQPSFDLGGFMGAGHVFQFTTHCDLVNNNAAAIQAASMAAFTVMALFIILRA
jgi:hypothetical protein